MDDVHYFFDYIPETAHQTVRKFPGFRSFSDEPCKDDKDVLSGVVELLNAARRTSAHVVNSLMTATYWEIGRRIVEHEQAGQKRAGYGEEVVRNLSGDFDSSFWPWFRPCPGRRSEAISSDVPVASQFPITDWKIFCGKRLRIGHEWFRVDLVLFHRRRRCLVIIDLKIGRLVHADIGQMNLYCSFAREHWIEERFLQNCRQSMRCADAVEREVTLRRFKPGKQIISAAALRFTGQIRASPR